MRLHTLAALALALAATQGALGQPAPSLLRCEFEGDKHSDYRRCRATLSINVPTGNFRVVCDGDEIYDGGFQVNTAILPENAPEPVFSPISTILANTDDVRFPVVKFDELINREFRDAFARLYLRRGEAPLFGTCDNRIFDLVRKENP